MHSDKKRCADTLSLSRQAEQNRAEERVSIDTKKGSKYNKSNEKRGGGIQLKKRKWKFRIAGGAVTLLGIYLMAVGYGETITLTIATVVLIFGIAMAIGTIPCILLFIKRTPEECGTLPYGMPLDAAAMEEELAAEAEQKSIVEPGWLGSEIIRKPFFWTLVLGAGLLNTLTTMTQLFATYVQFLGHDGWGGQAIVGLLLLSGTLEAFTSGGQAGGKVIVGFIESRTLIGAQLLGYFGGVIGLLMMWWIPQIFGEAGIWPMFFGGLFFGLTYACSTAMLPFLCRQIAGGREFDKIYSWMITIFNGIGAIGATGWAVVSEQLGWTGFFIGGLIVLTITFGLLIYTWLAGDKARKAAWYKSDEELAKEAAEAHIHAKA